MSCGQDPAQGGGTRQASQLAAGSDEAARRELEALSLDPPSALMPELQALQGQDQVRAMQRGVGPKVAGRLLGNAALSCTLA